MTEVSDHSVPLGWLMVRRLIRWRLNGAANQVLTARSMEMIGSQREWWLASEIADFSTRLETHAAKIRPIADLGKLPSIGNRLMVELAVYTAAAYRALLDMGVTEAGARSALADMGWVVYAWMLRLSSLPFRLATRDPGKRLRGTILLFLRFPFNAPGPPGYAVEVRREGEDLLTYWAHCPPQSFVRKLIAETGDKGDLDAFYESWCQYDWPGADVIAGDGKRGHYERRQTLSRGDSVCDMCWKARAGISPVQQEGPKT